MPLGSRLKEIECQDKLNYSRILTNQNVIYNEIKSVISQTRKEIIAFSSSSILTTLQIKLILLAVMSIFWIEMQL